MILRMPEYCRSFRCSAGECTDSCCIGWEIDIDEKTADYYMSVDGEFGERLKKGISSGDCYSFILDNERCPFLNDHNLCDIILNLGEDKLCHICNEHPRYYEWFEGVREGGVGLCCEEAAKLILTRGGEDRYYETEIPCEDCDEYYHELYRFLYEVRERMMDILREDNSLRKSVTKLLSYASLIQECIDNGETELIPEVQSGADTEVKADIPHMLSIFRGLEPIDEKWKPYIDGLEEKASVTAHNEEHITYIRNIGIYFIWRYFLKGVYDEEILSKVKLAVISMAMAGLMFGAEEDVGMYRCAVLAKNYSKEIEYSEENLEALYDMTYTERLFFNESLAAFFE
ncbi:MAG: flagellin lysine-N-methylase [Ruminiclostridium sp.]|nr:flagellin lysine-N-methylase [Ruminiclostridium sp.]